MINNNSKGSKKGIMENGIKFIESCINSDEKSERAYLHRHPKLKIIMLQESNNLQLLGNNV